MLRTSRQAAPQLPSQHRNFVVAPFRDTAAPPRGCGRLHAIIYFSIRGHGVLRLNRPSSISSGGLPQRPTHLPLAEKATERTERPGLCSPTCHSCCRHEMGLKSEADSRRSQDKIKTPGKSISCFPNATPSDLGSLLGQTPSTSQELFS